MPNLFRIKTPVRTFNGHYADYHRYKKVLAKDFNHKCGYTDCSDHWFGGVRSFQIDHFLPKSKYPERKCDYNNLVYCCSYVNRAKSDDDNALYLDPCDTDYNAHFERDENGFIFAKTRNASYMINKLHLSLARYAIMWNLDRLENRIDELRKIESENSEIQDLLKNLLLAYYDYMRSLRLNL